VSAPAIAAACVLAVAASSWPYTVDDAFITARYARNLARGLGYAMNPGQPSDGVTAPLWLLPQIAAHRLGIDPIAIAKSIGAACAALSAWLVLRRLQARAGGRTAAIVATPMIALSPSLGTWAASGLETGLATLLATIAVLAATRSGRPAGISLGACVAALAWLRPELAPLSLALIGYAALRHPRAGGTALALALAAAVALLAFRWTVFGDPLPLSYRAKLGSLEDGARYALTAVVLATSLAGAALAALGAVRGRRGDCALGVVLLVHVAALVLAGGDWMPGYRLLVPVLPAYALLAAVGAARLCLRAPRTAAALVAFACLVPSVDLATRIGELRPNAAHRERLRPLASTLARQAGAVALLDIGYLGYASGAEVVDLGGLTDPRIARMPGGHLQKRIDPAYFRQRNPSAIVLHSRSAPVLAADGRLAAFDGYPVERRIAALPFVREQFRVQSVVRYAPGYHYVVLARPDSR
jgi:hypothetical protein